MRSFIAIFLCLFVSLCLLMSGCGSSTNSVAPPPPPPANQYNVVGYYPSWGTNNAPVYNVKNVVTSGSAPLLTHIIYSFGSIQNNQCVSADPVADYQTLIPAALSVNGVADTAGSFAGNYHQLQELKTLYPNMQIEVSVGGGGFDTSLFSAAASPSNVQSFVASCINMYIKGNFAAGITEPGIFTGFDIDWECPASASDKTNFSALMAEFRKQLDAVKPGYQLTIAAGASSWCWQYYDVPALTPSLSFYNVMTYDFDGSWNSTTGFVAPLYQSTLDPDPANNANYAIDYYLQQGVPASKLVMGMPFYNYEWTAVTANNNGLFQPGTANQNNGGYALTKSMENTAGYTLYRDTTTQEPWLFNSATGDFWTFDDPTSLAFKTNYVVNKKLGGVMFWELSSDDANATLLKSMTNTLK